MFSLSSLSCRIKACDAVGDDEPPAFSDDEEEQAYYENLKKKNSKECSDGKTSQKRQRRMGECVLSSVPVATSN